MKALQRIATKMFSALILMSHLIAILLVKNEIPHSTWPELCEVGLANVRVERGKTKPELDKIKSAKVFQFFYLQLLCTKRFDPRATHSWYRMQRCAVHRRR